MSDRGRRRADPEEQTVVGRNPLPGERTETAVPPPPERTVADFADPALPLEPPSERAPADRAGFVAGLGRAAEPEPRRDTPPIAAPPPPKARAVVGVVPALPMAVRPEALPKTRPPATREWTRDDLREAGLWLVLAGLIGYALHLDSTVPRERRAPRALSLQAERGPPPRSWHDRATTSFEGPATLVVSSSPPGAVVRVDGAVIGETPLVATATPSGPTLRLALELAGHEPFETQLPRAPNGNFLLQAELAPTPLVPTPPTAQEPERDQER